MRTRLHVLLLLLLALPLRGGLADAMAMEVAQAALQATAAPSTATAPMPNAAMPADCPMHHAEHAASDPAAYSGVAHMAGPMASPTAAHADSSPSHGHAHATGAGHAAHATAADPGSDPHAGHAGACTLCDVCHGASLASAPAALGAVMAPHAAPVSASTPFASVLRAPDLRPPIL
jgi:hypothetical protein